MVGTNAGWIGTGGRYTCAPGGEGSAEQPASPASERCWRRGPRQPWNSSAPGVSARPRHPHRWFPNQSQAGRFSLHSFCLLIRIHKVHPLNKILGAQYSIYRHHVVEQMSRTYSSCVTETLYPLSSNSPFFYLQPLTTTALFSHSILSIYEFNCFRFLT